MRNIPPVFRAIGVALVLVYAALFASVGLAKDAETSTERLWQQSITGQIEAFRRGDSVTALSFAGFAFQMRYQDLHPDQFVLDIARMGYEPIIGSKAHSFGAYRWVGKSVVIQEVNLRGPDQGRYRAFYQLQMEVDGWRVQGVSLRREAGLSI